MGRPVKYNTDAERREAQLMSKRNYYYRNRTRIQRQRKVRYRRGPKHCPVESHSAGPSSPSLSRANAAPVPELSWENRREADAEETSLREASQRPTSPLLGSVVSMGAAESGTPSVQGRALTKKEEPIDFTAKKEELTEFSMKREDFSIMEEPMDFGIKKEEVIDVGIKKEESTDLAYGLI
ncbi:hypothetical protein C8J56DRAFT_331591 [Mycena floridula]|nr:hypothetical protein C8J56DRAFT_331591 [Mycena floridula]